MTNPHIERIRKALERYDAQIEREGHKDGRQADWDFIREIKGTRKEGKSWISRLGAKREQDRREALKAKTAEVGDDGKD